MISSHIVLVNNTFQVVNIQRNNESINEQITNYPNTNHNHYIDNKLLNTIKKSETIMCLTMLHVPEGRDNGYHDDNFNREYKLPKNTIL